MRITPFKAAIGGAAVGALAARLYDVGSFVNKGLSYINHKIVTGELPVPAIHVDSYEKAFYGNGMWESAFAGAILGVAATYIASRLLKNRKRQPYKQGERADAILQATSGSLGEDNGTRGQYAVGGLREAVLARGHQLRDETERRSTLYGMGRSGVDNVSQQDLFETLYATKFNLGMFPTSDAFENFGIQLMNSVISEGGHSGKNHRKWFEGDKINFPVNVFTMDTLYKRGRAEIEIDPWGNLTVKMNGVLTYYLAREGYLDESRRTYTGTGELGRVLDIIQELAPKFTGEPVGGSVEALLRREQPVETPSRN